jgi:hypothetical protein
MRHADDDKPSIFIALGCGLAGLVVIALAVVAFMPNFIHAFNAPHSQLLIAHGDKSVEGGWSDRTVSAAGEALDYGESTLYVDVKDPGVPRRFSVTADLSLPLITTNQSASYLYMGLDVYPQRYETESGLPYLQVGIVRSGRLAFRPALFHTIQKRRTPVDYHQNSTALTPGFHRFGVAVSDGSIVMSVDGEPILREAESDAFAKRDQLYVQIVSAVSRVSDSAAGDARDIKETTGHDMPAQAYLARCIYVDRGVAWYPNGESFHASGQFAPNGPSMWRSKGYDGCNFGH